MKHERMTVDPRVMVGKPVIKGTRIPVEQVLHELAGGMSITNVMDAHPRFVPDDVYVALAYAADVVGNEDVFLSEPGD